MSAGARWPVVAVALTGTFVSTFTASSLGVALPDIGADLGLGLAASLWISGVYLVTAAAFLIPMGRVADARGRAPCFVAGMALFGAASLAAAAAQGEGWLIVARGLQGVAGAMVACSSTALVTTAFPPARMGRAIGLTAAVVYVGFATGPVIGGMLAGQLGWRWIFLVTVPVCALALAGSRRLPWGRGTPEPVRLDLPGWAAMTVATTGAVVLVLFGPVWGMTPAVLGLVALTALAAVAFVAIELRVAVPLVDLRFVRANRRFAIGNLGALLNASALYAVPPLLAALLRVGAGRSAEFTGLALLSQPVLMAALSPVAGALAERVDARVMTTTGMAVITAGLAMVAAVPAGIPVVWLIVALALIGTGMALFGPSNNTMVFDAVDRARLASAAGLIGTMRYLGQAVSLAVLGGIVALAIGRDGERLLFAGEAAPEITSAYLNGIRIAMVAAAVIAVGTALLSARAGPRPRPAETVPAT